MSKICDYINPPVQDQVKTGDRFQVNGTRSSNPPV